MSTADVPVATPEKASTRAERVAARLADSDRVRGPLENLGSIVVFSLRVLRDLPTAIRMYPAEVASQCGYLIRSNALVLIFMQFMFGAIFALTILVMFESIGLASYVGAPPPVAGMRGVTQIIFGWVLAAKAGCGIVAELGAMRISEEIDAMDVMGIQSRHYLVGTRVAAALIVLPPLYLTGLVVFYQAGKLFSVQLLEGVSAGGYDFVLYLLQTPRDLVFALAWATVLAVLITVIACFYGYNASGGPVGVGRATAQSMLVNLVVISVVSWIIANLFYAHALNEGFGT